MATPGATTEVTTALDSESAVADAFLDRLKDAEKPSEGDEGEETEETEEVAEETEDTPSEDEAEADEDAQDEPSEEAEEETEEKPKSKKYADDSDTYVKVKVGEEEHEVAVKDLKRLWGQEASLTKKSQEVA